jgi:hypothetical protein
MPDHFSVRQVAHLLEVSETAIKFRIKAKNKDKRMRAELVDETFYIVSLDELRKWRSVPCKSGTGRKKLIRVELY